MPPNNYLPNNYLPKKRHWGYIFVVSGLVLLFLGALGFGVWAFMSREDYKNNTNQKIATAVEVAKQQTASAKDNEFVEKEKLPLKHYTGPSAYGSVDLSYPKTWSAYVIENGQANSPIEGYFHPGFVPNTSASADNNFALRLQITATAYDQELKKFDTLIKTSKVKVTPYVLPKVGSVTGSRLDGEVIVNKKGSMIILPMRDKTLKLWTETPEFVGDFNNNILPNFVFIP